MPHRHHCTTLVLFFILIAFPLSLVNAQELPRMPTYPVLPRMPSDTIFLVKRVQPQIGLRFGGS
jgi:hypothetical protein